MKWHSQPTAVDAPLWPYLVYLFSRDSQRANHLRQQMTADMAHDLRSPLTVISGHLEGLRSGALDPTPERFEMLYSEVRMMQHMIEDLSLLAALDAGDLHLNAIPLHPRDLLHHIEMIIDGDVRAAGAHLTVECGDDLLPVMVDPDYMSTVFARLIRNALDHDADDPHIMLTVRLHGTMLLFEVRDSGPGVPPDALPYIFERFYRVDPARVGPTGRAGLGLAICRAVVQAHDGVITAENLPGNGAVFRIMLPVAGQRLPGNSQPTGR